MSHELRTPLSAILGITEGLQHGVYGCATVRQKESYDVIEQSANHLLALINEVLDLAKIESGSVNLEYSPVDVRYLCESSLQLVELQAEKKNIRLTHNIPFNMPAIEADEKRLHQILLNLLSNAIKFTNDYGDVSLKVNRLTPDDKYPKGRVRFCVTDTGIGIDESHIDTVFKPFMQVDSSLTRNYEGTGLGLALVKQFVELHSGDVHLSSELGKGSCFFVDIPIYQTEVQTAKVKIATPEKLHIGKSETPIFVLLAEDNQALAKTTMQFFESINFRVVLAQDGQAAIDMASAQLPDIILMDIQMPNVGGLEAIRRLRKVPDLEQTPIIALTGRVMPGDAERCFEAGANRYLCKPYPLKSLIEIIRELTSGRLQT